MVWQMFLPLSYFPVTQGLNWCRNRLAHNKCMRSTCWTLNTVPCLPSCPDRSLRAQRGTFLVTFGEPDFFMGFNVAFHCFSAVIDCGSNNLLRNLCLILTKKVLKGHPD